MTKVKVQGIYSTSVSKFLEDRDFKIVGSSDKISERLDIEQEGKEPDVRIRDKRGRNGIEIKGDKAEEVMDVFEEESPFIFVNKKSPGTLYKGVVFKIEEGRAKLELGGDIGILFFEDSDEYLEPGDEIIVQEKGKKDSKPLLTTQLRFFSDSLVLIEDGYNKVSKNINDPDERERLKKVNKELNLDGWGILWKSSAKGRTQEELKQEVHELLEKKDDILKEAQAKEKPGLLKVGDTCYQLDFGLEVKKKLDKIRQKVTPTVKNHHSLKSGDYSNVVDLTEEFLNKIGEEANEVLEVFLSNRLPEEGDFYKIEHIKPVQKVYIKGEVKKREGRKIILKRDMRGGGEYDGLEIPKEEGDYALTYIEAEDPCIMHEYYNEEGELKGKYISINTGVEMFPWFSKYLDLGIDIIVKDGESKIIDKDELGEYRDKGRISQKLYKAAIKRSRKVEREVE